ncbi:MAG TPA: c-type cytochrome [Candidatus Methylomirabilis sp.]|nr:c-type cytochrome [Candidatus Methylomirabilis sp.]
MARHWWHSAIFMTLALAWPCIVTAAGSPTATSPAKASNAQVARGRYLVNVGNCNDCHTHDYAPRDGNIPETEWLKGSTLGFSGPWGTTYAPNLRFTVSNMTEGQFVAFAKTLKTRPPMPWFNLNRWSDQDLRALYQYVKSLGAIGKPAPQFVPADKPAPLPYIQWPPPPK